MDGLSVTMEQRARRGASYQMRKPYPDTEGLLEDHRTVKGKTAPSQQKHVPNEAVQSISSSLNNEIPLRETS